MKSERKILYEWYKKGKEGVAINDSQQRFIKENYLDEDYIIGIHNTDAEYKPFFEKGILTTHQWENQLVYNTVMYNDLYYLMQYANGEGKNRGKTAIILKIPKSVFEEKAGIFEELEDGQYCIPPEFIIGALQDGKIIRNEEYLQSHTNKQLLKCNNKITFQNKRLNAEVYERVNKPSLKERIKKFFSKSNKKQKLLPEPTEYKTNANISKGIRDSERISSKSRWRKSNKGCRN